MGLIECHSHLLPFVDDGVRSKDDALRLLDAYAQAGFDRVVVTPHLYNPLVATRTQNIRTMFTWAYGEAQHRGVQLILGSETYIGGIADPQVLPFLNNFVLLEVDTVIEPLFLLHHAYALHKRGLTVILAHIERYRWFSVQSEVATELRKIGVYFQCNVDALKEKTVQHYLEKGWVDIIAGDNHGDEHMPARLAEALNTNPIILKRMENLFAKREEI